MRVSGVEGAGAGAVGEEMRVLGCGGGEEEGVDA